MMKCAGFDQGSEGGDSEKLTRSLQKVKKKLKTRIKKVSEKRRRKLDMRESAKRSRRQSGMMSEVTPLKLHSDPEDSTDAGNAELV